jgi:hypothetical protein
MVKKMQLCVLHKKRTNWDLFCEQVKSTLNTQMSFKDYNDIMQAIERFDASMH